MTDTPTSCDAHDLEIIGAMTECAFALGKAASRIAEQAPADDLKRFLAASAEFRHCFFAVRMGIRLKQAIRAGALVAKPAAPVERLEREPLEHERPDAVEPLECDDAPERPERLETEHEGDYEPVSLARFFKTLGHVADRAEARRDDLPPHIRDTTLPTLRGLLRQANAPPDGAAPAVTVLTRPPAVAAGPAARSRLLNSTGSITIPALHPTPIRRRDSS